MKRKISPVQIRISPEHKHQFKAKARARGLTLSAWLLQAALAYERKAKKAESPWWASGWRKDRRCHVCKQFHDPVQFHPEIGEYDEEDFKLGGVWEDDE